MTRAPEILIRKDIDEVSRTAAELFVSIAKDSISDRRRFAVALSGGSTPRSLYRLLTTAEFRNQIDWSRVFFFFGDERCVPQDSPESNYRMAFEALLEPLAIPETNVFFWHARLAPDNAASDYEQLLKDFFAGSRTLFDLVLLGMGSDGHTASLFPQTNALAEESRLAVANWVDSLHTHRLTLTFTAINSALNVIFLVSGADKSHVLADVLAKKDSVRNLPAIGVHPEAGRLIWLVDAAAAARLKP